MARRLLLASLFLSLLLSSACSGTSTLTHVRPNGEIVRVTVLEDSNAFGIGWHYSMLERCPPNEKCELLGNPQYLGQSGYLSSMLGAIVQGGSILGSAYFVGKGLSEVDLSLLDIDPSTVKIPESVE